MGVAVGVPPQHPLRFDAAPDLQGCVDLRQRQK